MNTPIKRQTDSDAAWQHALKNVITEPKQLCAELGLDPALFASTYSVGESFALRVPRSFVARMQKGNLEDPLLKQILPVDDELIAMPGYTLDPLQEHAKNPVPGLLHKYQGRLLLLVAGACAIHCRYCFRRHFPYSEQLLNGKNWERVLNYIAADPSISEVIYSGGDPLVAKDKMLASITHEIASIPHVKRLRIHTRLPIVIPERVTEELLQWLTGSRLHPVVVVHCNHAHEIDHAVTRAMQNFKQAHVTLLNQAVLLRGVNDSVEALVALSEKLFEVGVLPYYLHMLDRTAGTAHFAVSPELAQQLLWEIMQRLPGYLVPKLVREQAGVGTKLPYSPIRLEEMLLSAPSSLRVTHPTKSVGKY